MFEDTYLFQEQHDFFFVEVCFRNEATFIFM